MSSFCSFVSVRSVCVPLGATFSSFLRVPQVRRFPVCSPVQYVLFVPCSLMMDFRFYQGLVFFYFFKILNRRIFLEHSGYLKKTFFGVPGLPFQSNCPKEYGWESFV